MMLVSGEAPVPPSWPEMRTTSEWAFATPAATVPTPISETSFTWMRALGGGDLLSPATLAATRDFVKGPGDVEAGLGIYAFENDYGPGIGYLSSGSGYGALAFHLPDQDVAVVVLSNQTDAPTNKLTTAVLEIILGEPPA